MKRRGICLCFADFYVWYERWGAHLCLYIVIYGNPWYKYNYLGDTINNSWESQRFVLRLPFEYLGRLCSLSGTSVSSPYSWLWPLNMPKDEMSVYFIICHLNNSFSDSKQFYIQLSHQLHNNYILTKFFATRMFLLIVCFILIIIF